MFEGFEFLQNMPQQIVDNMTFTAANIPCIIAYVLVMTGGFLVWFPGFSCCLREKRSPYPIWMHCWYISGDFLGTIFFWYLAVQYDFFYVFVIFGIGLPLWMCLEAFNIYQAIKNEKEEQFQLYYANPVTSNQAWSRVVAMVIFFTSFNLLVYVLLGGIENAPLFIVYPFTNFILSTGPMALWNQRAAKGTRYGNSVILQIIILIEIILTILPPGFGWWTTVSPAFDNPFYYAFGVICVIFSINNLKNLLKLPPKEPINGKKCVW